MPPKRRLAAVMFTDLAGFTTLTHSDERGAMRLLAEQEKLFDPLLASHHGRKIKSMGDGLLIEFANARDAVECAVAVQQAAHERNSRSGAAPLRLRIGVHVGDVEVRGSDILGDAVNIASRIEPLAPAGGVCLSAQVVDQVRRKVAFKFEKMSPTTVKGVEEPLELYRVVLPWQAPATYHLEAGPPRLAVLPFSNISPDPNDAYFADGLSEELTTVLSRLQGVQVIARTSVIPYKSTDKPLAQVGAELGVSSILEGSVRKAGSQLRITAQLIDVGTQAHRWAGTYDRTLDDIFAVQTDVAERIAEALKVKIEPPEEGGREVRTQVLPASYEAYLRGRALLADRETREGIREARKQFEIAATIDSNNANAFSGLADVTTLLGWSFSLGARSEWRPASLAFAHHALALDPNLAEAHCSLGVLMWDDWNFHAAEQELRRALDLNPSYSFAHYIYAALLLDEGRSAEAYPEMITALELDPRAVVTLARGIRLLCWMGRVEEAEPHLQRLGAIAPDSAHYHGALAWKCLAISDFKGSLRELELAKERASTFAGRAQFATVRALTGDRKGARRLLEQERRAVTRSTTHDGLAVGYALIGDLDEAFRQMKEGATEHDLALQWIRTDARLRFITEDPRFGEVLRLMNLD